MGDGTVCLLYAEKVTGRLTLFDTVVQLEGLEALTPRLRAYEI